MQSGDSNGKSSAGKESTGPFAAVRKIWEGVQDRRKRPINPDRDGDGAKAPAAKKSRPAIMSSKKNTKQEERSATEAPSVGTSEMSETVAEARLFAVSGKRKLQELTALLAAEGKQPQAEIPTKKKKRKRDDERTKKRKEKKERKKKEKKRNKLSHTDSTNPSVDLVVAQLKTKARRGTPCIRAAT
jgi:hypothetical protein